MRLRNWDNVQALESSSWLGVSDRP